MPEEQRSTNESKLRRLEELSRWTGEMMSGLFSLTLDDLLARIASSAVEVLAAETCGVFLIRDDQLSLEASIGHREGGFEKGKRLQIRSGHGLTGHIAYERRLFNKHGEELKNHPAVAHESVHTLSGRCESLLALPLLRKRDGSGNLVGLLRVDNKRGEDGNPSPTLYFDSEDEWILTLFGDAALVAIENAELLARLKEQQDFQERLIDSSPDGIIAVDRQFRVKNYNNRAEEILGYGRDGVLGRPVQRLYVDPEEPRSIGKLLRENGGRVREHETAVRSKTGEQIPVRLSAVWLRNAQGDLTGSAGYFEDLRPQRLLLEASNLLATADLLDEGLQNLAEMIVSQLGRSFCGVLLADESGESLILRGVASLGSNWQPRQGERLRIAEWHGLRELHERGKPSIRRATDPKAEPILKRLTALLRCERPIRSLLVVPLTRDGRIVGQLDLGELEDDPSGPFTAQEFNLAEAIASQISSLVDRMRLRELNRRTYRQFAVLHQIGDYIQATDDLEKILRTIMTGVTASYGLGFNRAVLLRLDEDGHLVGQMGIGEVEEERAREAWRTDVSQQVDDFEHYLERLERGKIPDTTLAERVRGLRFPFGEQDPFTKVVRSRKALAVDKDHLDQLPASFLQAFEPNSALALAPLVAKKRVLGVLAVDNKFTGAAIGNELIDSLMTFASTAAIVLENKRLLQETLNGRERSERMAEAADALVSGGGPSEVLQRIVTAATRVLEADGSVLWIYDQERDNFLSDRSVADGVEDEVWHSFRARGPRKRGTAYGVLKEDRIEVKDIQHVPNGELGKAMRDFLAAARYQSLQGVALKVGRESLGVLYVLYREPRGFDAEDREAARTFASHAALALKKAKLLEQVQRARRAAEAVTRLTPLGDQRSRGATLDSIALATLNALECGAVVLFEYAEGELIHPPAMEGLYHRDRAENPQEKNDYELVRKVLESPEPWVIDDVRTREDFQHTRFARDEKVASCVALPLRAPDGRVGVMFVNYRTPRIFTQDEITGIELFADQAAIAISNARLFDERTKLSEERNRQLDREKKLANLSEELLGTTDLQGTMDRAVAFAADALGTEFCTIILPDAENRLIFSAGMGWPADLVGWMVDPGIGSQTGYTIAVGGPVAVEDYAEPQAFTVPEPVRKLKVVSGLSAPMLRDGRIVGAMLVHTRTRRRFSEEDKDLLSLIANQTAIAVESARRFGELKDEKARVKARTAFGWVGMRAADWSHQLRKNAMLIQNELGNLRQQLASDAVPKETLPYVDQIEELVKSYAKGPEFPRPLDDEGLSFFPVNQWLAGRLGTLRKNEPYRSALCDPELGLDDAAMARGNVEWLHRSLDILVDNAIKFTRGLPEPKIQIGTRRSGSTAVVFVTDNGPGIPLEIRGSVFSEPIKSSTGLGIGLLTAYTIIDVYGGRLEFLDLNPGTSMIISLPLIS